ncbi:MAG: AAA family ATPase, partial [Alphaproteobacteria bacterium]|nr:AAA family ATPase [Alphaproteobacteria bacterium]
MQLTRLKLSGFKSFVDQTELAIEPGLTGIVGPNGCGKSNLVEALRWVMGENSAKRMRGGEMDDVIFGGTGHRPPRNLAEVALSLDNSGHAGEPTPMLPGLDQQELEVVRRIERGSGSDYRINGREVRARDVQLLFADAATGAHSTALVSQGRIGAIINAKPIERRGLLEEAAGISGLHSRRHEAELRLKAAETNLTRLDDVITTLQSQFEGLKKQAKQAGRYRRLCEHVRRAESILLHLRWQEAAAAA